MTTFIYPTVQRVTSDFRSSNRPQHHGTDFAERGYHEILASADGVVSRSYRSTSYGECIMIEHEIEGDIWETVYAHLREGSRKVFEGDRVKQGQVIGVMGSTGYSTGQHLHFELHKGKWNINKTNALDPLDILGKDLYPTDGEYIVQSGDTLSQIAQKVDNTVKELVNLNNIDDPDKIYVGQVIKYDTTEKVYLPAIDETWRIYPLDKAPTVGNEKGKLKPKKFGGLVYEVLDKPQEDVVTIQSQDFGKGNIYVAPSTGAIIK